MANAVHWKFNVGVEGKQTTPDVVRVDRQERLFPSAGNASSGSKRLPNTKNFSCKSSAQIFLRSMELNAYLSFEKNWCANIANARCFSSALEAELLCRENGFTGIQLVVHRRDRPPFIIPLTLP